MSINSLPGNRPGPRDVVGTPLPSIAKWDGAWQGCYTGSGSGCRFRHVAFSTHVLSQGQKTNPTLTTTICTSLVWSMVISLTCHDADVYKNEEEAKKSKKKRRKGE